MKWLMVLVVLLLASCTSTEYRVVETFGGPIEYPARPQGYEFLWPGPYPNIRKRTEYYSPDNPPPPYPDCYKWNGEQWVRVMCK